MQHPIIPYNGDDHFDVLMQQDIIIHKASTALQIITEWRIRSRLKCKHINW